MIFVESFNNLVIFFVLIGLCALSISNDNCYLAYPGSATIGEVQVFDTINLVSLFEMWRKTASVKWSTVAFRINSWISLLLQRAANMIPAHDSPLAALAFDASGTKLATASEKVKAQDASLLPPVTLWCPRWHGRFSTSCVNGVKGSNWGLMWLCGLSSGDRDQGILHSRGAEAVWVQERSEEVGVCESGRTEFPRCMPIKVTLLMRLAVIWNMCEMYTVVVFHLVRFT